MGTASIRTNQFKNHFSDIINFKKKKKRERSGFGSIPPLFKWRVHAQNPRAKGRHSPEMTPMEMYMW